MQILTKHLKCKYCNKLLPEHSALQHMKDLHFGVENNCPICKARQIPACFNSHIKECHSDELFSSGSIIQCTNCCNNFLWEDYVVHSKQCSRLRDNFTCKKCNNEMGHEELFIHYQNISCPTKPAVTNNSPILEDPEYQDLIDMKKDFKLIYTPTGGKQRKK